MKAEPPLRACFRFADTSIGIRTNSPAVLEAARATFGCVVAEDPADFTFDLRVHGGPASPPLRSPVFRGRDHLVFAQFGEADSVLFNLETRTALGCISESSASNSEYWRRLIFPVAIGIVAPVLGIVPLHAACVVVNGAALVIAGESGAGKSTLSLAMAKAGREFISDDWTFLSGSDRLSVASLPVPVKLLPDTLKFFPELRQFEIATSQNGEEAFEVDPQMAFGVRRRGSAAPRWVVLLDRRPGPPALTRWPADHMVDFFASALDTIPRCLAVQRRRQLELVRSLEQCQCWRLQCEGSPEEIGALLERLCLGGLRGDAPALPPADRRRPLVEPDHMRRLAAAPVQFSAVLDGHELLVETNEPKLRAGLPPGRVAAGPAYRCTILVEPPHLLMRSRASCARGHDLFAVNLGREGMIALDHAARRILACVSSEFALSRNLSALLRQLLRDGYLPAGDGETIAAATAASR